MPYLFSCTAHVALVKWVLMFYRGYVLIRHEEGVAYFKDFS